MIAPTPDPDMSRFHLATGMMAVSQDGVSLGTHSIDTLEYEGRGARFLVEWGYDEQRIMIIYHPPLSALPERVAPSDIYDEILDAARVLNRGRAEWGDAAPVKQDDPQQN